MESLDRCYRRSFPFGAILDSLTFRGCNNIHLGCVSLGKSENESLIQDHLDHRASKEPKNPWTDESTLAKDSSVPLMHGDPSDLGSVIRFRIFK